MKLAVFKDYGVGRYFAQFFDSCALAFRQPAFTNVDLFVPIADIYFHDAHKNGLALKAVLEKTEQGQ